MKNNWIKYLLLVLLAIVMVACSSDSDSDATATSGSSAEATEEPMEEPTEEPMEEATEEPMEEPTEEPMEEATEEPMEEPTEEPETEMPETSIVIWADDTRAPILSKLGEQFAAEYGVGLDVQQVADIRDQFVIAAPAGEGPDIIVGAHDWLGQLVSSGLIAPIDLGGRESEFSTPAIDVFTYDGQLYGMPYATENLAFFYNADLVDAAPTTWDEVMEVGAALIDSGDATYAMALTGTTYDDYPMQTAFGGYALGRNEDGTYNPNDVGIDSEGMIAAGEFIAAQVEAGTLSGSSDWDTAHSLFETGEIPFIMAGPWALDRLRESGVNYVITDFPDGGYSFFGGQGFMVNSLSDNVLLAQAFLTEFVATESVMNELAVAGNRASAFKAVQLDDPDLVEFNKVGENAAAMPTIPEMGSVWGAWGDAFALIMSGDETPEAALTTAAAQIRELIGGSAAGMVNVPGSWQSAAGFDCEWDPACVDTALTDNGDGTYSGTFNIPAGEYEVKVALEGGWDENYGLDGKSNGDNIPLVVDEDSAVTFTWDSETKILDISQDPGQYEG